MIPARLPRRRRAFTLIEILVATGISVILVLGVVRIATYSLAAYDNATALASATATARTVLDTLESDLQCAILHDDGFTWLEALPSTVSDTDAGRLADKTNIAKGADLQLQFFATPTDRDKLKPGKSRGNAADEYKGDTCAIRYRLMLRNPLPLALASDPKLDRVFALSRSVINAEDTFSAALPSIQKKESKGLHDSYWKNGPTEGTAPIDTKAKQPQAFYTADLLANNVIGLTPIFIFRATKTDPAGVTTSYHYYLAPETGDDANNPANGLNPDGAGAPYAYAAPLDPKQAPTEDNHYDTSLKLGASWAVKDAAGKTNAELAALPADAAPKSPGTLVGVIIALTVLDDAGADQLRALHNQTGTDKIDDKAYDEIYAAHAHFFTRRINLSGR